MGPITEDETPRELLVRITPVDFDAAINCASCDYSTAGSDVRVAGINHVKQTGHTVIMHGRIQERIEPA